LTNEKIILCIVILFHFGEYDKHEESDGRSVSLSVVSSLFLVASLVFVFLVAETRQYFTSSSTNNKRNPCQPDTGRNVCHPFLLLIDAKKKIMIVLILVSDAYGKPASGGEAPEPRQRVPRTVAPGNGDGKKEGRTGTAVALCLMDVYTM
jgi:hypothetical protein